MLLMIYQIIMNQIIMNYDEISYMLDYNDDVYIKYRLNIINLINDLKQDKNMAAVDYILDYYEL